jgi:DNA-binding transcriptional ArsR family regulator
MKDLLYVEGFEQADALLKPQRVEVLRHLAEPRSCTEVGLRLDQSPQRVYYHVRRLVDAELVAQVAQRRVRGIDEGVYQAVARSYWLSPRLVGPIGGPRVRDELSLGYLIELVEDVQGDLAALDRARPELPTLGVSGRIRLPAGRRAEFFDELRGTLRDLFARYGGRGGDDFQLAIACYPKEKPDE